MDFKIEKVVGPRVSSVERSAALEQLQTHPEFPKGAILSDFKEVSGHWEAELKIPAKEAAPAFMDDAPPSDSAPTDEAPEPDMPKDDSDSGEKKDGDKKDDKVTLDSIMDLVKEIATTVGVPTGDTASPPADDLADALKDLPATPDAPTDAPKGSSDLGPSGHRQPTKLKPGEVLPNQTPIGAPAFSSTQTIPEEHPWKDVIGKVATFTVSEETDTSIRETKRILDELGEPYGYKAKQMVESHDDKGNRVVRALISRY